MAYKVITPPTEPIGITEARAQCRITHTDEDDLIGVYITAARKYCEHYLQRSVGAQTLELALDEFPDGAIELPMSPATSITSIKYINTSGVETTLSSLVYTLDDYSHLSWVLRAYGTEWPETQEVANAVKIRYVAGESTVPAQVRAAMLLMIEHLFENRAATGQNNIAELPLGVKSLLDTYRIWSL